MNKKDAADYLGFSVKNLERLMAEKKIEFKHIKGKYGKEVDFDLEALDTYKTSLETSEVIFKPAFIKKSQDDNPTSLTKITNSKNSIVATTSDVTAILQQIAQSLEQQNQQITVPLDRKLTLSLVEASQLAGLSVDYLRKAIQKGELKAAKRGKGWNLKRTDLEMFVEAL